MYYVVSPSSFNSALYFTSHTHTLSLTLSLSHSLSLSHTCTPLQGQFLFNMGLVTRVEQVLDAPSTSDEQAQTLVQAAEKILAGDMGSKFKAIAITHAGLSTPGFEVS
jgi:SAM-dependent MidA family methyltransferase